VEKDAGGPGRQQSSFGIDDAVLIKDHTSQSPGIKVGIERARAGVGSRQDRGSRYDTSPARGSAGHRVARSFDNMKTARCGRPVQVGGRRSRLCGRVTPARRRCRPRPASTLISVGLADS